MTGTLPLFRRSFAAFSRRFAVRLPRILSAVITHLSRNFTLQKSGQQKRNTGRERESEKTLRRVHSFVPGSEQVVEEAPFPVVLCANREAHLTAQHEDPPAIVRPERVVIRGRGARRRKGAPAPHVPSPGWHVARRGSNVALALFFYALPTS